MLVDAVLADLLPAAAAAILTVADAPTTPVEQKPGLYRAADIVKRLAAAAPETTPSAPVPAGNAPAVPEEADGQQIAMVLDELNRTGEMLLKTRAERDRLAAQVAQVLSVHRRFPYALEPGHFCGTCQKTWPCKTVDALSDAGTDQTEDDHG